MVGLVDKIRDELGHGREMYGSLGVSSVMGYGNGIALERLLI